jgi:hypothetical protein
VTTSFERIGTFPNIYAAPGTERGGRSGTYRLTNGTAMGEFAEPRLVVVAPQ